MAILDNIVENEYARFLIIFIGTIIFVTLSYFILKLIVKKISRGKKSYAQFILKQLSIPVFFLVFIIGLYTSFKTLSRLDEYSFLIDGAFFIITTLIIALFVSRILTVITMGWLKVRRGFKRTPGLLNKAITVLIFIIAIAVILAYFKVDITPLIAGVGLGALAIGLALQSTLSNFFAGVHLLSDRPINVGDFIELDENTTGIIEDIGWRSTRIRMLTDNLLIIPNGKLADSNIINYSMPNEDFSIWIPCGVAYDSDLKKVEKITLDVAKQIQETIPGAKKDFEPGFRYREFGDSNINFVTILRIEKPMDRFVVRNEFIKALKERYDKEKIEISWPIRKIYQMK
ncbi:MAG: mechanosensitive ion channel family protein [Thermoplasmatales archaeon]|nr:MAG: mechanosensitive ion channel family protein [Thermoplasmatales archaeon]